MVLDKIYDELRAVPATMIMVCGLYMAVAWLFWDHIPARDFYSLRAQLIGVQTTLRRDHLDSRIHAVESELFILQQRVEELKAKGAPVDQIYYQRMHDLSNQSDELRSEINLMERSP